MRINKTNEYNNFRILILDDDSKYVEKKVKVLKSFGYNVEGETNVKQALSKLMKDDYDLLILDYLMNEMRGDKVVEEIRKFDNDLYILLLTGYAEKSALEIMNNLDITAYCEKSNDNNQLLILIKSALKSVEMMKKVKKAKDLLNAAPKIFQIKNKRSVLTDILKEFYILIGSKDSFIIVDNVLDHHNNLVKNNLFKGSGIYGGGSLTVSAEIMKNIDIAKETENYVICENGVIMPMLSDKYGSLGVIYAKLKSTQLEDETLKLIKVFSSIAASSITNALLQNMIEIINGQLQNTKDEAATWYLSTVNTLKHAIDAKDHYTGGHSGRVSEYSIKIGKALELNQQEIYLLRDSGVFHDLGKIGIDDSILKKKGKITEEEYEEIKKHPQKGALILSSLAMFKDIIPIILCHHERFDGKGYPNGLKGEEIPFLARILCVADSLDAMTTDRTYKEKKSADEALAELKLASGTQFDPYIVKITIDLIKDHSIIIKE